MILIELLGGLGNQLFQYAAAKRLSIEKNLLLKLDIQGFQSYTLRTYKLNHFAVTAEIATTEEINYFTNPSIVGKASRWVERRFFPFYNRRIYYEQKQFQFEPEFLQTRKNVYLRGYFQSEKYFKPIENLIRQEFTIKTPPNDTNVEMAQRVGEVNAVSLHIRRGDYVSNSTTNAVHGVLSLDYYHQAAKQIAVSVPQPHFFIFSDDPTWVSENLKLAYPMTFVDHNDASHDYEDLRLMSLCKHHIIANSSFSWWGAWLAEFPDKMVFAPKRWVNNPNVTALDILPTGWQPL